MGVSLSPSPSAPFAFSFGIGMQPCRHEWHPALMLMRLLDMLCVHACCRVSLPLALLAIQFCFVLPPWVILILNLILNYTRLRVYKTVEQHLLLLCPTPPAVSPM